MPQDQVVHSCLKSNHTPPIKTGVVPLLIAAHIFSYTLAMAGSVHAENNPHKWEWSFLQQLICLPIFSIVWLTWSSKATSSELMCVPSPQFHPHQLQTGTLPQLPSCCDPRGFTGSSLVIPNEWDWRHSDHLACAREKTWENSVKPEGAGGVIIPASSDIPDGWCLGGGATFSFWIPPNFLPNKTVSSFTSLNFLMWFVSSKGYRVFCITDSFTGEVSVPITYLIQHRSFRESWNAAMKWQLVPAQRLTAPVMLLPSLAKNPNFHF